jgi:hypothetical protein
MTVISAGLGTASTTAWAPRNAMSSDPVTVMPGGRRSPGSRRVFSRRRFISVAMLDDRVHRAVVWPLRLKVSARLVPQAPAPRMAICMGSPRPDATSVPSLKARDCWAGQGHWHNLSAAGRADRAGLLLKVCRLTDPDAFVGRGTIAGRRSAGRLSSACRCSDPRWRPSPGGTARSRSAPGRRWSAGVVRAGPRADRPARSSRCRRRACPGVVRG